MDRLDRLPGTRPSRDPACAPPLRHRGEHAAPTALCHCGGRAERGCMAEATRTTTATQQPVKARRRGRPAAAWPLLACPALPLGASRPPSRRPRPSQSSPASLNTPVSPVAPAVRLYACTWLVLGLHVSVLAWYLTTRAPENHSPTAAASLDTLPRQNGRTGALI